MASNDDHNIIQHDNDIQFESQKSSTSFDHIISINLNEKSSTINDDVNQQTATFTAAEQVLMQIQNPSTELEITNNNNNNNNNEDGDHSIVDIVVVPETNHSSTANVEPIKMIVENVVENILSKQDDVTDINNENILIRKSSRILRLRKTDNNNVNRINDEEFINNDNVDDEDNVNNDQNKQTKKRRTIKSKNNDNDSDDENDNIDDDDDDYHENVNGGGDDDDDEFRPLKKRKIIRRSKQTANKITTANTNATNNTTASTNTKTGSTSNETNRIQRIRMAKDREIERLQMILYKCYKHNMLINKLNRLLMKMNGCLMDKIYNTMNANNNDRNNEDDESLSMISVGKSLLTLIRSKQDLPDMDNFIAQYDDLIKQYDQLDQERKEILAKIDDENVEQSLIDQTIGPYLRKPKKKFTMFDMIGVDRPIANKSTPKNNRNSESTITKRKRPAITNFTESHVPKKAKSTTGDTPLRNTTLRTKKSKRKTNIPINQEDSSAEILDGDEKAQSYHPCPWINCTYESKREWALNEHINLTHTGLKQFGCKVDGCPMMFFSSSELDNHMKKCHVEAASKEFMPCTWPGCNALFKSRLGLRAHLQVHKGENLIQCDWPGCNYTAKNKRQHENHLRKHTGDRPFSCDYPGCDSKFRTNDSLRHHKKSHSEYRPFRCDWPGCEANFKTNRGLTIHRALHTGEKLFKCDWPDCEFASERKYHVDLHVYENHTHIKPYPCSWMGCDASFLRNDKLQNHLKIHRQEKPFKCIHPSCEKHFVEKGNMMKHFNNVHKR
uniref:Myb-like protein D n=1 Tax=Dermatophagoides pteronyssinus TaxID=6956 RepID=A0A6P6XQJ3_DERPT|nr:myb-like protein D [Dermatophagoides pteronyssinus]